MLFSATLDGDVDGLVQAYMQEPVRHEVESDSVTVDAMTHRFLAVHHMDKVRSPPPSPAARGGRCCSCAPSGAPTGWPTT